MPIESQAPRAAHCGAARAEADFYRAYAWCLNPLLSLGDLFLRLREELQRADDRPAGWQREETRVNLFLFVCGIACIVDDHLARRLYDLSPVVARFPRLRAPVAVAQWVLDACQAVYGALADRSVTRWRARWGECVDRVCEVLTSGAAPSDPAWSDLRSTIDALAAAPFPEHLRQRRLPLPAAFRNQDLTHHDVLTLAERFAASYPEPDRPVVVIAPRSAGSYFAPLVKQRLATLGWRDVTWFTVRPKKGLSRREQRFLGALTHTQARVLLVDEPAKTGTTFQLMLDVLKRLHVRSERIVVLAPRSPARPDWTLPGVAMITLDPRDYYKGRLLAPGPFRELLREYQDDAQLRILEDAAVEELNARLCEHHRAGFHVRLKRVFAVRTGGAWRERALTRLLAKGVGWGWLGYHAYFAATRLAGFVPPIVGLRNGLLLTEWVGALERRAGETASPSPRTLGAYVGRRVRSLRLDEDPEFRNPSHTSSGWRLIVDILRRPYGLYVGRLKIPALRRKLRRYVSPVPTLIDGRMKPDEWVATDRGILKTDFEQHSFGKTELNIVDPAHELASAIFEFGLSAEAESQLLQAYAEESADPDVGDRLLLYKLLVGVLALSDAASGIAAAPTRSEQDAENARYHAAREFLIDQVARYCGRLIPRPQHVKWSNRLFFLDLDGVFDCEGLGFPHTTPSGLAALALLRSRGFAVVLNTGRSVADTRGYCAHYALPGGVAELGSVFFDAVAQREVPLIDRAARAQLVRCAQAVTRLPGVFTDPSYRYAVRAYRFRAQCPVPLEPGEVEHLLTQCQLDRLAFSPSSQDTIILPRGIDKGHGLVAVREYLGGTAELTAAMGDSERDLPMLEVAELAFAPAGCSPRIRALAGRGRCRVTAQPMQRGLFAVARRLTRAFPLANGSHADATRSAATEGELVAALLRVAERPRLRQLFAALHPWGL